MMKIVWQILLVSLWIPVCMANALESNDQITRTITSYYLENGKLQEAVEYLNARIQNNPEDQEALYLLAHMGDGSLSPHLDDDARDVEDDSLSPHLDDDAIDVEDDSLSPHFTLRLLGGHDSNVLLLEDPNVVPTVTTASWFIKPSTMIQIPLKTKGFEVEANSNYTHNFSKNAQIYDNIFASLVINYNIASRCSTYISSDFTWYNLDNKMKILSIRETFGLRVIPLQGKDWNLALHLPVSYAQYPKPKNPNPTYNANGIATSPSVSLKHRLFYTDFTETFTYTKQHAKGSNLQLESFEERLGFSNEVIADWVYTDVDLGVVRSAYRGSNPKRIEQTTSASVGVNFNVQEFKSIITLSAAYMRNYSTLLVGNYKKYVISLGVSYEAF